MSIANAAADLQQQQKPDLRKVRARQMLSSDGDIRKIRKDDYLVKSQVSGRYYHVRKSANLGWVCECPDFMNRRVQCKHIYAVKMYHRNSGLIQKKIES